MQRIKIIVATIAFLLLACPAMMQSQELAGTLSGSVKDTSGAVIPDATVSIALQDVNGTPRVIHTDVHGSYTATNLAAGTYTITVEAKGFETFKAQGVTLFVAQTRDVDAELKPGQVSQTVTVEESSAALETTSGAVE